MRKLIVANWKLNMPDLRSWHKFRAPRDVDAVVCPPFPYLSDVRRQMSDVALGAQDCFWGEKGAYTGEVAPAMIKSLGAEYVIIGHSERRRWFGETDEMINKKVKAALNSGLRAILCVGEPLSVRRKGLAAAKRFVANQLRKDLKGVITKQKIAIAYEPIWAIGTGRADKPEEAAEMASFIKKLTAKSYKLKAKVLYGGSVTSKNAADFLKHKEIDGALVGGASLKAAEFGRIIARCK